MAEDQIKSRREAKKPKKSGAKKSMGARKSALMVTNLTASSDDVTDPTSMLMSHVSVLRSYARCLVRNRADADDLVQDCLVRALSRIHLFEPGTNLKAWLLAIIRNIFLDDRRRGKRAREFIDTVTSMVQVNVTGPSQLHRIELTEAGKALSTLPEVQRSALLMCAVDGLNYQETAKVCRVPVGTVRSRLSRGRSSLRAMVQGITSVDNASARQDSGAMSIRRVA